MKKLFYLIILGAGIIGCTTDSIESETIESYDAKANAQNNGNGPIQLDTPEIVCGEVSEASWTFDIVTGETGAPNGFQLEWMTMEDYMANGESWEEDYICSTQLTGIEVNSNETYSVELADFIDEEEELSCFQQWDCEEEYLFRVRSANVQGNEFRGSDWSELFTCETQACEQECESGYMEGNTDFSEIDNSNKWGWANYFELDGQDQEITMDILKDNASGNHDPVKLGEVTVTYMDENISVSAGENVEITHLFVSETEPTSSAPGEFNKTQEMTSESGNFWVIVKADVCE